jgi:hypothetical protein
VLAESLDHEGGRELRLSPQGYAIHRSHMSVGIGLPVIPRRQSEFGCHFLGLHLQAIQPGDTLRRVWSLLEPDAARQIGDRTDPIHAACMSRVSAPPHQRASDPGNEGLGRRFYGFADSPSQQQEEEP